MARKRHQLKGVFCLEGDWWGVRDPTTVEPVLSLLEKSVRVPYIHRNVGTRGELVHYLRKWVDRGQEDYRILYLAFHGHPGVLVVSDEAGDDQSVTLEWLGERLQGLCAGQVIHFGSCSTIDVPTSRLKRFLDKTGAVALCGYKRSVEWVMAASFESMLLYHLQYVTFTRRGMEAVRRRTTRDMPGLRRQLAFRLVIR